MKDAMTTQIGFKGSETEKRELLGGTKENGALSNEGSLICPLIN